jgi:hypothetical protein
MIYEIFALNSNKKKMVLSQEYQSPLKQKIVERIGSENFNQVSIILCFDPCS